MIVFNFVFVLVKDLALALPIGVDRDPFVLFIVIHVRWERAIVLAVGVREKMIRVVIVLVRLVMMKMITAIIIIIVLYTVSRNGVFAESPMLTTDILVCLVYLRNAIAAFGKHINTCL